ncbi:hypothetical protein ACQJBY_068538 [Aegilops geniculata]
MRARMIAYYFVELFCPKDTIKLKISFVWKFTMGIEIMVLCTAFTFLHRFFILQVTPFLFGKRRVSSCLNFHYIC